MHSREDAISLKSNVVCLWSPWIYCLLTVYNIENEIDIVNSSIIESNKFFLRTINLEKKRIFNRPRILKTQCFHSTLGFYIDYNSRYFARLFSISSSLPYFFLFLNPLKRFTSFFSITFFPTMLAYFKDTYFWHFLNGCWNGKILVH